MNISTEKADDMLKTLVEIWMNQYGQEGELVIRRNDEKKNIERSN